MNISDFINSRTNKIIDVDGFYGGQCWDLWSDYAQQCFGISQAATNTVSGYADSVYYAKWSGTQELQNAFSRLDAGVSAQYGDVAFWNWPHVAIVIKDDGDTLNCLTQNPGAASIQELSKHGLIGYFRPRVFDAGSSIIGGAYECVVDALNVRSAPNLAGEVVATYSRGGVVNLDNNVTISDGYRWGTYIGVSGNRRYIALGTSDGAVTYLRKK